MATNPSLVGKPSLTLQRRLKAPPTRVYRAWTDPQEMKRWWGADARDEAVLVEADVRVGGRFRVVTRTPGGEEHDVSGVYREVVPDTKLVFSWAWRSTPERESLVTIALSHDGEGTLLTLRHEQFFDQTACDNHGKGWSAALGRLERLYV